MSGALLGFPGPWAEDNREPSDHYTTKIGGLPDWPLPVEAVDPSLLHCPRCQTKLCLVAQVYAPVSSRTLKIEERSLLVFGCLKPECCSSPISWRALRIQKEENDAKESSSADTEHKKDPAAASTVSVSNSNWWESLADEDDEDADLEDLSKSFAEATSLNSQSKKTDNKSNSESIVKHCPPYTTQTRDVGTYTAVLPCFYIYSQAEASSKGVASLCSNYSSLSVKEIEDEMNDHGQERWAVETYEYDKALTADRTYFKFKKQLDAFPEQCFRYAFGGKPILASAKVGDAGKCTLCGASRHFEMQLMPPLIYFLQEEADDCHKISLENWNWLTLAVYTCSKSCSKSCNKEKSNSGDWFVVEETVILQCDKPLSEWAQRYFTG